jgi:transposase InsO family protein
MVVCTENLVRFGLTTESLNIGRDGCADGLPLEPGYLALQAQEPAWSRERRAEAQQLIVLQRKLHGRVQFTNSDRLFFIQLYRWFPSVLKAIIIIRPETLVRWHRAGFRRYWRCKSRTLGGRPQISADLRALIRRMSVENVLWGAPRIHGELLKLGFAVAQSTVAKYMAKKGDPSGQSWGTFLRNHMPRIAAMDLFVVPTVSFNLLYVLVIVRLARWELVWIDVTAHATAEWIAQQITEAFPWNDAPRYLIRDRDGIYGAAVTRRLRAMGIRDKPIAPGSPWQNGYAERLIGTLRRECLDHMIVFGETHLRRILGKYVAYYNGSRIHRALNKDAPFSRAVEYLGVITSRPVLGGLHHQYCRIWFSVHTGRIPDKHAWPHGRDRWQARHQVPACPGKCAQSVEQQRKPRSRIARHSSTVDQSIGKP